MVIRSQHPAHQGCCHQQVRDRRRHWPGHLTLPHNVPVHTSPITAASTGRVSLPSRATNQKFLSIQLSKQPWPTGARPQSSLEKSRVWVPHFPSGTPVGSTPSAHYCHRDSPSPFSHLPFSPLVKTACLNKRDDLVGKGLASQADNLSWIPRPQGETRGLGRQKQTHP